MDKNKTLLCIFETVAFNYLIYLLFFQLQNNQDVYLQLNPHPLFLLSIAIGMRYGNYLGIISGAISTLFYLKVFGLLNENYWEAFMYFKNYKQILLIFWSAVIFGYFRDNHSAKVKALVSELSLLSKNYKGLKRSYEALEKTHQELKKQIVGSEESILSLYEIASRLHTLDSEEIYTETIGILSKYLKAKAIAIHSFNEESGYLRLKIRTGEEDSANRSMHVRDSVGFQMVALNRKVIKWPDVREKNFPLMAAPIIREDKVVAIASIIDMEFDQLSEYAFQLFKLIIDWVNKALNQAIYVDSLRDTKYLKGTKVLHYGAFLERLKAEERRRKEFGMDYVFVEYRTRLLDLDAISLAMSRLLRTVDVIGYDVTTEKIAILLPATAWEQLPVIEARILNYFGDAIKKITEEEDTKVLIEAR